MEKFEYFDALMGFEKSPHVYKTKEIPFEGDSSFGSQQSYVAQYRYNLLLDLYFVVCRFSWLSKEIK